MQDEILPGFLIRQTVHFIHRPGYGNGGIKSLVVERHLQLKPGVGTVLQGVGNIVGRTVGRPVGDGYRWIEIVIVVGKAIDLWQQFRPVF